MGCPLAGLVVYLSGGGGNVGRKSTTEQVSFEQLQQDDREAKNPIEDALDEFEKVTDNLNILYQRKALEEETQPDFKDRINTMGEIENLLKHRKELGDKIDKLLKEELKVADSFPPERVQEMTQKIDAIRNWQSRWKRASLRTR